MDMHPLDGQRVGDSKGGFRGFVSEGVVRDFVLKLHGPRIGYEQNTPPRDTSTSGDSDDAFYGAYIAFDFYSRPELGLVTGSKVTLTLTPTAPLLDGSPAQTLVRTMPIREESTIGYRYYFRDIPIGDYSATATLTAPDGRSHKLQLHLQGGGGDYATAAPVIFQPWEGLMGVRHVHLITKP